MPLDLPAPKARVEQVDVFICHLFTFRASYSAC